MPDTLRDPVAAEAEAILLSVVHTVYQHDTYVDVETGTYDMDCSGYVGYVLQRIAPRHYQTIPSDSAAGRPLAREMNGRIAICIDLFSRGGLAILDRIESRGFDVLSARPALGRWTKFLLLARALVSRMGRIATARPSAATTPPPAAPRLAATEDPT